MNSKQYGALRRRFVEGADDLTRDEIIWNFSLNLFHEREHDCMDELNSFLTECEAIDEKKELPDREWKDRINEIVRRYNTEDSSMHLFPNSPTQI